MSIFTLIVLAFAMSLDSFAVSLSQGLTLKRPNFWQALKIGGFFGVVEGIVALIGWLIGYVTSQWIEQWDHWVAFILLSGLGIKILYETFASTEDSTTAHTTENELSPSNNIQVTKSNHPFWLMLTALGTSIDAMTIGVSLAFLTVNIWLASLLIGLATTIMATTGILLGRILGEKIGRTAEIFGGSILIIMGSFILIDHLNLLA